LVGPESPGGTPAVAAVGGIHGDEPCGVRAIDRFLRESPVDDVQRPVNFERVPPGTVCATTDTGDTLTAETEFWPVLLSTSGHDALPGYAADRTGAVGAVADE